MFTWTGAGYLVSSMRSRITSSRFAAIYLTFVAVYSVVLLGLHAQTFTLDKNAANTIDTILISGRSRSGRIPALAKDSSLGLCSSITESAQLAQCLTVWNPSTDGTHILAREDPSVIADQSCLLSLNYPAFVLHEDMNEDAVGIVIHLAILGLAVAAIVRQTLPHFLTAVVTQLIAMIWSAIRLTETMASRTEFEQVIANGACGGPLLGNFWSNRMGIEIGTMAVNVFSLLLMAFLTWKAINALDVKTSDDRFSVAVNRVFKVSVAACTVLELSMIFSVAFGIVWINHMFFIDNLIKSVGLGFKVYWIIVEVLMVPLFLLGWFAIRREMWKSALVFCGCSFIFVVAWGATFMSKTFRYSITNWTFFGFTAILSFILAVASFILGVVCTCYFGKGMKEISHGSTSTSGSGINHLHFTPSNISSVSSHSQSDSISSMEKGEMKVSSFEEKRPSADNMSRPDYGGMPKAKAQAHRRGLSITPPPLQYVTQ